MYSQNFVIFSFTTLDFSFFLLKNTAYKDYAYNKETCGCKTRKQQSPKWLFLHKGNSQGHNVTELGVI